MDFYRPSSWVAFAEPAKSNPTRPAIVIVHGGSFEYGRKNDTHLDQASPTDEARFAQHGFAAVRISHCLFDIRLCSHDLIHVMPPWSSLDCLQVSIDYRLSATSFLPELAAIRDASEEYGIDPDRIAVVFQKTPTISHETPVSSACFGFSNS